MKENLIETLTFDFALEIINTYKKLISIKEFIISKQLLRSGTSIGAMVRESQYAESKADFIHKLSIGQKECYETLYWLELLRKSEFICHKDFDSLNKNGLQIMSVISKIIISSKKTIGKE